MASGTTPLHQLGTIGVTPDGRKFRYCRNNASTAAVAGELQQSPAEDTSEESLVMVAASAGATAVTTAAITVTVNEYADGYIVFTAEGGTGNGYMYRIKSHPATTAAALTLQLYEPLEVAITTSTQADLVHSPYNRVIQNPASATSAPVGVAVVPAAADEYFWVQTGGPGIALADAGGAVTVGTSVVASNQTAGSIEGATGAQAVIGTALTGIASAEFGAVYLRLD